MENVIGSTGARPAAPSGGEPTSVSPPPAHAPTHRPLPGTFANLSSPQPETTAAVRGSRGIALPKSGENRLPAKKLDDARTSWQKKKIDSGSYADILREIACAITYGGLFDEPLLDIDPRSESAPRTITVKVSPERIRDVMGEGPAVIRAVTNETGTTIEISSDGVITIAGTSSEGMAKAKRRMEALTAEADVGPIHDENGMDELRMVFTEMLVLSSSLPAQSQREWLAALARITDMLPKSQREQRLVMSAARAEWNKGTIDATAYAGILAILGRAASSANPKIDPQLVDDITAAYEQLLSSLRRAFYRSLTG